MKYCISFLLLLLLYSLPIRAEKDTLVRFTATTQRLNDTTAVLTLKARVVPGIQLYCLQKPGCLIFSSLLFDSVAAFKATGHIVETGKVKQKHDDNLQTELHYVTDSISWQQAFILEAADSLTIKTTIQFTYSQEDAFITGEHTIRQKIPAVHTKQATETGLSLWSVFILAFAGGLLALLTPCVYSMIPVTVGFFTKRSGTVKEGRKNAVYYALSIVLIFTVFGFLITLLFGPAALNRLATNWIANLLFFLLFLLFGLSFLGAFNLSLPSGWLNKAGTKSATGSFSGIFFMALTLVLVSFSCTGPIIGNLLVLASKGNYLGPLTGMFGFSLALALPFACFAFFPGKLNRLAKAGGWMNSIKVVLGFLELALALKFLSNADLVKGWRLLDREIFIVLWVVIFVLLGLYAIGKIKFHHDDELPKNDFGVRYLSIPRLLIAIMSFSFSLYLIPGLWGAPLKAVSSFVPPMGTQDFNASPLPIAHVNASTSVTSPKKYVGNMSMYEPEVVTKYGLTTFYDYEEALIASKELKKPIMLDFTGINCVNCRKMEGQVWSDPEIREKLKNDFIIASLYVDAHHIALPSSEQFYSEALGKEVETAGDLNAHLQVQLFGTNSQPNYFFIDHEQQKLSKSGYGYDPDIQKFKKHLDLISQQYQQIK